MTSFEVFIDNPANQNVKTIFDEESLIKIGEREVALPYPYPYGFILNTLSGDGDCVDCFVLTDQALMLAQRLEVDPLAILEMNEDHELDSKIVARPVETDTQLTDQAKQTIELFLKGVFSNIPGKIIEIGAWHSREAAVGFIMKHSR